MVGPLLLCIIDMHTIDTYAQNKEDTSEDNDTTSLGLVELGTLIGLSGIISGALVAIVDHMVTMVRWKNDREFEIIQNRSSLYQFIIFHLQIMMNSEDFKSHVESRDDLKKTIHEFDTQLESKLSLLHPDAIKPWLEVRRDYKNLGPSVEAKYWDNFSKEVNNFHSELVKEFNNVIIEDHKKIVGISLRKKLVGTRLREITEEPPKLNISIDNERIVNAGQITDYLSTKSEEDIVEIKIQRDKGFSQRIQLKILEKQSEEPRITKASPI
jgi:hypothetical protein